MKITRTPRTLARGGLALIIAALIPISGMTPAQAEYVAPGMIGYDPQHITLLGTFRPKGYPGQMLCIDARKTDPTKITKAVKKNAPFVAYAAHVYQQTKNKDIAAGYAVAVGRKINTNKAAIEAALKALPSATRTKVSNIAAKITKEADNYRGPYNLPVSVSGDEATSNAAGKVVDIGVKSEATGKWVPGLKGTLVLTSATFADGTTSKNITTTTSGLSEDYTATATGDVTAKLVIDSIPPVDILIYQPQASGYQRVMINVKATKSEITTPPLPAVVEWQPSITTAVKDQIVMAGTEIIDVATATKGRAGVEFAGRFDFYALDKQPVESDTVPDGLKPFATSRFTATFDDNGEAKNIIGKATPPKTGKSRYFTVVASIDPNPAIGQGGYTAKFGEAPESGLIVDAAISTKVSAPQSDFGKPNEDIWTITGVIAKYGDAQLSFTAEPVLYGPLTEVSQVLFRLRGWGNLGYA